MRKGAVAAVSAAVGAAAACGVGMAENRRLTVTSVELKMPGLPASFDGLRLVQLSDLHDAVFGQGQKRLLRQVNELAPDLAVLTGDFIDRRRTVTRGDMRPALRLIEGLSQKMPVLRVDGNHEAMSDSREMFRRAAAEAGARDVTGRVITLRKGLEEICVFGAPDPEDYGLDTPLWREELSRLHMACRGRFAVALSHRPQYFEDYVREELPLVLCGHAHGGQVRLPLIGGLFAPDQGLFPKYTAGKYEDGGTVMVVSRGLGNSGFPLRFGNPPEVLLITLYSDKEGER